MKFIDAVKLSSNKSDADYVHVTSRVYGTYAVTNYRCLNQQWKLNLEKFQPEGDDWDIFNKESE
jgi:spore coat polysaccharide biosynthesis protein SpsF (cytidylyltransferase family)